MPLSELERAGRAPSLPLSLELADAAGPATLQLLSLLRVLPGQRYVGAGVWRGRPVLAKLLVGPKAARHFQRELQGVRLLEEQSMTTPLLLADGLKEGEGGWLLFEFLEGSESLGDAWKQVESLPALADEQQAVLAEALAAIAELHGKGLWQEDLHLDNLLRHQGKLYLIDGAGICVEQAGKPLSRQKVLENLGVFFAQLPKSLEPFTEELLVHYLLNNAEHALPLEALQKQVDKVRSWRLKDFLNKVGRECTLFSVLRGPFALRAIRREEEAAMLPVLEQADALLDRGHLYKTGGAASVGRVEVAGRTLVVKRYNIKGFAHWLKRFWRPSRAWHSWQEGNRLAFLGIATPKPLALLEKRFPAAQPSLSGDRIPGGAGHHRTLRALYRQRRGSGSGVAGAGPAVCRVDPRTHQPWRLQGAQPVLARGPLGADRPGLDVPASQPRQLRPGLRPRPCALHA